MSGKAAAKDLLKIGGGDAEAVNGARKSQVKPNNESCPGPTGNTCGPITPDTEPNPNGNSKPEIKATEKEKGWWDRWGSTATHGVLGLAGFVPGLNVVSSIADAAIYGLEGEAAEAAIALAGVIPGEKWVAAGAKGVKALTKGEKAVKEGEAVAKELKAANKAKEEAEVAQKAAQKKAEKEAAEKSAAPAVKPANGKGGAKDRRTRKRHKNCGKLTKYNQAPPRKDDGLEADHVPSGAALKKAAENELKEMGIWDDLTQKQQESVLNKVYNNAQTILVPDDVHAEGRTHSSKNTPTQINEDAADLNKAAKKDVDATKKAMKNKSHGCKGAYKKASDELLKTDFKKYVKDTVLNHPAVKNALPK